MLHHGGARCCAIADRLMKVRDCRLLETEGFTVLLRHWAILFRGGSSVKPVCSAHAKGIAVAKVSQFLG
jgi:hypothetical protein